jgi:hypothetical protein
LAKVEVDGFHVKGMTQHQGHALLGTKIGEPIPGEDTLNGHDQPLPLRSNGLKKRFWGCLHESVQLKIDKKVA